jgi:hypothetical protein
MCQRFHWHSLPGLWIRIRIGSGFNDIVDPDPALVVLFCFSFLQLKGNKYYGTNYFTEINPDPEGI